MLLTGAKLVGDAASLISLYLQTEEAHSEGHDNENGWQ